MRFLVSSLLLTVSLALTAPCHLLAKAAAPLRVLSSGRAVNAAPADAAPQIDTAQLYPQLDAYLAEIDKLGLTAAEAETDFMISAVQDSSLRNDVAIRAYRHFRDSKVMGAENIAIHIYDVWFASFKTVFPTLEDLDDAEFHALVNRRSLIGAKAPELTLATMKGDSLTIPAIAVSNAAGKDAAKRLLRGRFNVVYFYSTGCPKCLYTSLKLKDFLSSKHRKLNFYAIYTGDDQAAWKAYSLRELKVVNNCRTKVYHLQGGESDYPLSYAVLQTPRLFLISPEGTVVGRNLDVPALEKLLSSF